MQELGYDPYESINCQKEIVTEGTSSEQNSMSGESKAYDSSSRDEKSVTNKDTNHFSPNPSPLLPSIDLYSKVKKDSSISDGLNLNQDSVSIYELTKVDSNANSTENCESDLTLPVSEKVNQNNQPRTDFREDMCIFGKSCSNKLCSFQHDRKTDEVEPNKVEKELKEKLDKLSDQYKSKMILCGYHRCNDEEYGEYVGSDIFNITDEFDDKDGKPELFPCEECDDTFE